MARRENRHSHSLGQRQSHTSRMTVLQVSKIDQEGPSKDVAWYHSDVEGNIRPEMRDLLLNYSKIPAEELVAHITQVVCQP